MSGEREILLGVSASIAIYKALEIVSALKKERTFCRVVMTPEATRLVAPVTFAALSEREVITDLFARGNSDFQHIELARSCRLALVAPATANIIAKLACGMADDPLSTCLISVTCPILVAPAMNTRMYENRFVQRNLRSLEKAGYRIIPPGEGELACGEVGAGKLAPVETILAAVREALSAG